MALKHECLDIAAAELIAADVPFEVSNGGKHLHVRFRSLSGEPQLIVLSKNGGTGRHGYSWVRTNIRRKLRSPKKSEHA